MTGSELKKLFEQETDLAYTGYYDDTKLNRWFEKGFINVIQSIYLNRLSNQNAFDEINYLISTEQSFSLRNNRIFIAPIAITNVINIGTTIIVTTEFDNDLLAGDTIFVTDITGFTTNNPNGVFVVSGITSTKTFVYIAAVAPTGAYTQGSGVVIPSASISDYYHYFFGKAQFTSLTDYIVTASTNTTPIKITLNKRSFFRSGDMATIAGIAGNTNANGTFYLRQVNEFQYTLFTDQKLRIPVAGNGTQIGAGAISVIIENRLQFMRSDEKGTVLQTPTINSPFFQQSKSLIKILPSTETCDTITLDFMRKPPAVIDVTNTVVDFSKWYNLPLQYDIVSEVGKLMALSMRDGLLGQEEQQLLITNP